MKAAAHEWVREPPCPKRSTVREPICWVVCKHCGLILTKAPAAKSAARRQCEGLLDPAVSV